jgi:S1-C subfamily serine protease
MIKYIITSNNKLDWQQKVRTLVRNYNLIYIAVLAIAFCIAILPFNLKWISSANTEPREAVVRIETTNGVGSGFLISPNYILTARHVVEDMEIGDEVTVNFAKAIIPFETTAKVFYFKKFNHQKFNKMQIPELSDYLEYFESDVALLRLDEEINQISPLEFGNSDDLKAGNVLIMGYGLDDWSEPDGKVTSNSFHENKSLFKLDASINHGHSGGPVMLVENNIPTKVVGIVVGDFSTIFTEISGSLVKGESVALKINKAEQVLQTGGYLDYRNQ